MCVEATRQSPFRIRERSAEIPELLLHEKPGHGRLQMVRHTFRRRMRPVRSTKCVVDVKVAQASEPSRQTLVIRLFAAKKARIFEQQDFSLGKRQCRLQRFVGVGRLDEPNAISSELREMARNGLE